MPRHNLIPVPGLIVCLALVVSGIRPYDRPTWFLEVFPVLIAVPVLILTYRRFPLTNLLYLLICLHALVLILGGAYTYARVPLGFWLQDLFDLHRNPYDRLGHFMQGFVPAMISRELLLRLGVVKRGGWLFFIAVCICLAFSASYELFECLTAVSTGSKADAFLGTQGDPWDTQEDMAMALIGSIAALLALSGVHDRYLEKVS